jgi:hypothetical protein
MDCKNDYKIEYKIEEYINSLKNKDYQKLNIEGIQKVNEQYHIESTYEKVFRNIIIISDNEQITKKVLIAVKIAQNLDIQYDKIIITKSENIELIKKRDLIIIINEELKSDELIVSYKGILKIELIVNVNIESFMESYKKLKNEIENEQVKISKDQINILISEYQNESKLNKDIKKYYKTVSNIKELKYNQDLKYNKISCIIKLNLSPVSNVSNIKKMIKEYYKESELKELELKEGYQNKLINRDIYKVLKKDKKTKAYEKEIINSKNLKNDNQYVINDSIKNLVLILKNLQ